MLKVTDPPNAGAGISAPAVLYLVEHAAVPHHAALGVHVLTAALPGHLDDALYFWGNGQLPAEFSGEILERGKRAGTCHQEGTPRPETAVCRHVPQFIVWGLCRKKQIRAPRKTTTRI